MYLNETDRKILATFVEVVAEAREHFREHYPLSGVKTDAQELRYRKAVDALPDKTHEKIRYLRELWGHEETMEVLARLSDFAMQCPVCEEKTYSCDCPQGIVRTVDFSRIPH